MFENKYELHGAKNKDLIFAAVIFFSLLPYYNKDLQLINAEFSKRIKCSSSILSSLV